MKKNILLIFTIVLTIFLTAGGLNISRVNAETLQIAAAEKSVNPIPDSDSLFENIASEKEMPDNYKLFQNYPNPFNPTTVIKYAIPQENHITLKIYNSLGNEVKTLVDKTQSAGYHQVVFNGDNLSSGVYYAQLRADNFEKVIKMILVK